MNAYIQSVIKSPWVINNVLYFILAYNLMNEYYKKCYEKSYVVKCLSDSCGRIGHVTLRTVCNVRYEPYSTNWYTNCVLCQYVGSNATLYQKCSVAYDMMYDANTFNVHNYDIAESYTTLSNTSESKDIIDSLYVANKDFETEYGDLYAVTDSVFIMKYYNSKIVRLSVHNDIALSDIRRSTVSFLSVEYKHPKMQNRIMLEVDKSYLLVNNELFSPSFVKRLLEYQFKTYEFDEHYELVIVDINIEVTILKSKNFLIIGENDFTIEDITTR